MINENGKLQYAKFSRKTKSKRLRMPVYDYLRYLPMAVSELVRSMKR